MAEPRTSASDRWLAVGAVAGILAMVLIGLHRADDRHTSIKNTINGWLGGHPNVERLLVAPTQPYVVVPAIVLIIAGCLFLHRSRDAALAALAPAVAVSLNTWVLKPLFDRQGETLLSYPSGHTVGLVSTLAVLAVLARSTLATTLVTGVGAVLLTTAGIGMIGLGYHYAADVVGGACFAVAVVLVLRLVMAPTSRRPPAPGPSAG